MRRFVVVVPAVLLCLPPVHAAEADPVTSARPLYAYQEVMVPMRDGVTLQTVILSPLVPKRKLPILLVRTPYGVPSAAPTTIPSFWKALDEDGYIYVFQNVRGRFKSGGTFTLTEDWRLSDGGTVETRDGYDTVDWLVKNVADNNGRVGISGVSYNGYTAAATLLQPHPALKAVSEQASPVDWWFNDDMHHHGALRLSYAVEYSILEEASKASNTIFGFGMHDTFEWYLSMGPVVTINEQVLHGKIAFFNDIIDHPDYDGFWKSQAWSTAIKGTTVPTLNVAGFWDQEDPWGPWQIFAAQKKADPSGNALMVAGPWNHGAWNGTAARLGPMELGEDTARSFQVKYQAPFFAYWLHSKGAKPSYAVATFQTGSNRWMSYAAWPPRATHEKSLYLHADGTIRFTPPTQPGAHRDYLSDPANPVPYRARPISPTYPGGDWPDWESSDQRFVDRRPDVLTYVSAPLEADLTITGSVVAEIVASTSGTDGDLIVKLIDVFPDNDQVPQWTSEAGPAPGQYARTTNGYQLPIAMEVRRGRYLESPERPTPLTPNTARRWTVPLRERDHTLLKGHRVMVQIQSTWFPLIDRNPQTFVPSIPRAKAEDFKPATYRIFSAPGQESRIIVRVAGASGAAK